MNPYLSFSSLDKVYLYVHLEEHFVFSVSKVDFFRWTKIQKNGLEAKICAATTNTPGLWHMDITDIISEQVSHTHTTTECIKHCFNMIRAYLLGL